MKRVRSRSNIGLAVLVALLAATPAIAQRSPQRVIFDTDMGNDVDDALALAVLHALESRGESRLLAVTITKDEPYAAAYVDIVNTFYGRPDIPIGVTHSGITPDTNFEATVARMRIASGAPLYTHDLRDGRLAPDAVSVLRRVLAAQPDSSVVIAQTGFSTNLARLLASSADRYSSLSGRDLVARKVRLLQVMAGRFDPDTSAREFIEFNVQRDIASARALFDRWPTPIEVSGFEVGIAVMYPAESIERDYGYVAHHPVRDGYVHFTGARYPYDRPTWDVTSALEAVRPDRGYFGRSVQGRVVVDERGHTSFRPEAHGPHRYLTVSPDQAIRARETMIELASQPPESMTVQPRPQSMPLSTSLVGTWELLSRVDRTVSGERRIDPSLGEHPAALLFYDRTGHFAAQFMSRDRANAAAAVTPSTAGSNNSRAVGGYDAYFGTYTVNDATGDVTQTLQAALSPESVGMTVVRNMVVEGDTLTIKVDLTDSSGVRVTRTLIWKRVG